eukprot:228613_1
MPKRKSKKHKRAKRVKNTNKHKKVKKPSNVATIPQDLLRLIIELTTTVCPNHNNATALATALAASIASQKIPDQEIKRYCDPNVDSRKIKYFAGASICMGSEISICMASEITPSHVAFVLLNRCFHLDNSDHIDKCVEWCVDFFQSTQRPIYHLNIYGICSMYGIRFKHRYIHYLKNKVTATTRKKK